MDLGFFLLPNLPVDMTSECGGAGGSVVAGDVWSALKHRHVLVNPIAHGYLCASYARKHHSSSLLGRVSWCVIASSSFRPNSVPTSCAVVFHGPMCFFFFTWPQCTQHVRLLRPGRPSVPRSPSLLVGAWLGHPGAVPARPPCLPACPSAKAPTKKAHPPRPRPS